MKWLKSFKWFKFKHKINCRLPNYHPETGQRLSWDISIFWPNCGYNTTTGQQIKKGFPHLTIEQRSPMCLSDNRAYVYNWKKQRIERISGACWQ